MDSILEKILTFKESFFTLLIVVAVYYAIDWVMKKSSKGKSDWGMIKSIVLFSILLVGAIALILSLPMSETTRGNISSLIGIVISAVLALSSATFIGNGLAGVMLRTINNYRPGDFIKTKDHFGRVTERRLFHTEIQTENRDLITIPNLFLATNPVRTTRSSGTFISTSCSLGYDVNRVKIETALLKAAEMAELKDGFVRILELGDFSVVYELFGLLEDVKTIIRAESRLNGCVLDALHEAGIEIVSPNFMNQRQIGETIFIPKKVRKHEQERVDNIEVPEEIIFDKAEKAESLEKHKWRLEEIEEKVKDLMDEIKATEVEKTKESCNRRIEKWNVIKERLLEEIENKNNELGEKK